MAPALKTSIQYIIRPNIALKTITVTLIHADGDSQYLTVSEVTLMINHRFTYEEYRKILGTYKGRFHPYRLEMPTRFVLLRHDVEFSVKRAYEIAKIESQYGVQSNYFFQVVSSAYNPFSERNKNTIEKIYKLGHTIGLHCYVTHVTPNDLAGLKQEINRQRRLFEIGLDIECGVFSFHRPPPWTLEIREDQLEGLINAYGPSFFEYSSEPQHIRYIADSQHRWTYGHPLEVVDAPKIQLLFHPDEWTEIHCETQVTFFQGLIDEMRTEFIETLGEETKHFRMCRGEIS